MPYPMASLQSVIKPFIVLVPLHKYFEAAWMGC